MCNNSFTCVCLAVHYYTCCVYCLACFFTCCFCCCACYSRFQVFYMGFVMFTCNVYFYCVVFVPCKYRFTVLVTIVYCYFIGYAVASFVCYFNTMFFVVCFDCIIAIFIYCNSNSIYQHFVQILFSYCKCYRSTINCTIFYFRNYRYNIINYKSI